MMSRRPAVLVAAVAACLAWPAPASARIDEIGDVEPAASASCPARPCLAVSRTTGYQAKVGDRRSPHVIQASGNIVAWTIKLGKPGTKQTAFFDKNLGGTSVAQITVLDPRRKLRARAIAQGEPRRLRPYFGSTVQFALRRSIPVRKGMIVALTVPTWAPALAVGLGGDTSWRASRGKGKCDDTSTQTAQTQPNQLAQYYCLYRTARLTYSVTVVTAPQRAT